VGSVPDDGEVHGAVLEEGHGAAHAGAGSSAIPKKQLRPTMSAPVDGGSSGALTPADLDDLVRSASDMLFVWGGDGVLRSASALGAEALATDATDGIDADVVLALAARLRPGHGAGPSVDVIEDRAGTRRRWEWSAWRDEIGILYLSARDVTGAFGSLQNRRAHADVRHQLVKQAAPSIIVKDRQGSVVLANRGPVRSERSLQGPSPAWTASEELVMHTGSVDMADEVWPTADGECPMMVVRFALRDKSGTVSHVASVATDITGWLHVRRQVAERRALLDALVRASPDIISVVGASGRVLETSEIAFTSLGLPISGSDLDLGSRVLPSDRKRLRSWLEQLLAGQQVASCRYQATRVDGRTLVFDAVGSLLRAGDDSAREAVVVSSDVTDLVEAEADLEEALARAEAESRAKSRLLTRMADELGAPLGDVIGAAHALSDAALPSPQNEAVGHLLSAGQHLRRLVGEIVEITQATEQIQTLASEPVALEAVVDDAVNLARPLADSRAVRLAVAAPLLGPAEVRWPWVRADRQRLLQVLLNLLSNAIKYNRPMGTVRLSVFLSAGRVRIAVADTGHGIPSQHFDRLFEPFDRLGAEDGEIEGTGVGLALSKRLVEQMGGTIEVTSVIGAGSVFVVDMEQTSPDPTPAPGSGER